MYHTARWSSGLRLRPLTPATWVRIPYGSPSKLTRKRGNIYVFSVRECVKDKVGVYDDEGPPVPIPNTVVKLTRADNTRRAASREDRSTPTQIPPLYGAVTTFLNSFFTGRLQHSSIAQSVEHAAVNRRVVGSSPTWGAILGTVRTLVIYLL